MLLNVISVYLFATVIISLFLASYVQSRSGASYTRVVLYLALVVVIYMYGYGQELGAASFEQALFWNRFQYVGIPFVSAFWFTIALMYNGCFFPMKLWRLLLIYLVPVLTFIFRISNDYHGLYFEAINYTMLGDRILLVKEKGIWIYVQMFHSMSMVFTTLIIYIHNYIKKRVKEGPLIASMIIASLFAVLGLIFNIINPGNLNIDFMVIFLPLTVIVIVVAIMKHDFLEVKTMARDMLFENSSDGILLFNHNNRLIDYNLRAKNFLYDYDIEPKECDMSQLFMNNKELFETFEASEPQLMEVSNPDGTIYIKVMTERVYNMVGSGYGIIKRIRDITHNHNLEKELKVQATIDELSGLLNRREYMSRSHKALRHHMSMRGDVYVMMMDLDFFKSINDVHGHLAGGDKVIREFGEILRSGFGKKDIVGRFGGEEFAILLIRKYRDEVYRLAEEIRNQTSNIAINSDEGRITVTVSIGIAKMDHKIKSLDSLLIKADQALYASKHNGRNQTTEYIDIENM